jgi:transketolase
MANRKIEIHRIEVQKVEQALPVELPPYNREYFDDVAFMTAMVNVLICNYAQTGHFGGPMAYTPVNVALHLGGPELGALRFDIREPKHPYTDKFMLAGGHCIPTCYALWMILYEAMARQYDETGDRRYYCDPKIAILPVDSLGFRRSPGACASMLRENGLADDPLFAQAKLRGIRYLQGHAETTDVTNDVNGGPSGVGFATAAGKAIFWDILGAPDSPKIWVLEGEFAMTEGHAQELKTIALAQQVGKRLRLFLSFNNAGIDDSLIGGVIRKQYNSYDLQNQWASYGWNVFASSAGCDFDHVFAAFRAMEGWPGNDRRPMAFVAETIKGWWPAVENGRIKGTGVAQIIGFPSHPHSFKMNSEYIQALASSYENHFGVRFKGIHDGPTKSEPERLIQLKTNIDVALSVLEQRKGLRTWISERLLETAGKLDRNLQLEIPVDRDPFLDERLKPENLPLEPYEARVKNPRTGQVVAKTIRLFELPGKKAGTRRAISEIGKWINYVTGNRLYTMAADLSHSINMEDINFLGHYDPVSNPGGTRLKAGIQEAGNASTIIGLIGQTASKDPAIHAGMWGMSGTYGAFTPLMYLPARIFSQQNQDSPFRLGVLTVVAGHSGPETAADARSHFGIFSPQVWTLFPRGQVINLYFWDYNDVAPGYFAAVQAHNRNKNVGLLVIHVARPDFYVADRGTWANPDLRAAAKGCYLIRDWDPSRPAQGTVLVQGSSSTNNLVALMPKLNEADLNVRIVAVISEELFNLQPQQYKRKILPDAQRFDCMFVTTMTKRVMPLSNLGPLTERYSLSADLDDRWRTGGSEEDIMREAGLDKESIFEGIRRFVSDREGRLKSQADDLRSLFLQ